MGSERQIAYREFLKSDFWRNLSRQCKDRANRRCEDCQAAGVKLHSHHVSYPQDWFKTVLEQLRCLCDRCHRKAHGLPVPVVSKRQSWKQRRKAEREKLRWLAKQEKRRRLAMQNRKLVPSTGFTGTIFNGSVEEHDHRFSRSRVIERAC